ncbi:hypothetical protein BJP25_14275 [Actinokineospora bangkokensis]|uniref:STAS domain-containing protein n=1 Tax=Actinokineospora bangkokensis TaxID=1193682 RepID=A0A1Q9LN67_9PSEU|nr:hypothetical protein BJP25_14275 [Actinokineospora bangkokensis]
MVRAVFRGAVDISSTEEFRAALDAAFDRTAPEAELVVDLTPLELLAASGLRELVRLHHRCAAAGVRLTVLVRPGSIVARVIDIAAARLPRQPRVDGPRHP